MSKPKVSIIHVTPWLELRMLSMRAPIGDSAETLCSNDKQAVAYGGMTMHAVSTNTPSTHGDVIDMLNLHVMAKKGKYQLILRTQCLLLSTVTVLPVGGNPNA